MDKNYSTRIPAVAALLILVSMQAFGQSYGQVQAFRKAEWSRAKMDRAYDGKLGKSSKAAKVIEGHKPTSPSLLSPVGKCDVELKGEQLGRFVTGIMLDYATQRLTKSKKGPQINADLAIVKFRDANGCIPAGDVTPLDILSLFPIDNNTMILELKGKYLEEFIRNSAAAGAVSSQMAEPVEDERIYKVVTIDFLLKEEIGGDVMAQAEKMNNCNMPLSNTLIQHVKRLAKKGEALRL